MRFLVLERPGVCSAELLVDLDSWSWQHGSCRWTAGGAGERWGQKVGIGCDVTAALKLEPGRELTLEPVEQDGETGELELWSGGWR